MHTDPKIAVIKILQNFTQNIKRDLFWFANKLQNNLNKFKICVVSVKSVTDVIPTAQCCQISLLNEKNIVIIILNCFF